VSWLSEDGQHEGYVARVFADGALGAGVAPEGVIVSELGDVVLGREDWEHRPAGEVVGFVAACECGWRGLPWTRVTSPDRFDLTARRVDASDEDVLYPDGTTTIERLARLEWDKHTAPDEALVEVTVLAAEQAAVGRRLDAAVARARAAGASWDRIGTAAGITRQSAHERWRHVLAGEPAAAAGQA
jgi:hypothetical protein